jgi:hypothetical protein
LKNISGFAQVAVGSCPENASIERQMAFAETSTISTLTIMVSATGSEWVADGRIRILNLLFLPTLKSAVS